MPLHWVGWRLAHLSVGRPLRIKHHLLESPGALWQLWKEENKCPACTLGHCARQHSDSTSAELALEDGRDRSLAAPSKGPGDDGASQAESNSGTQNILDGKGALTCTQTSALDQHFRLIKEVHSNPQPLAAAQSAANNGPGQRGQHAPLRTGPKKVRMPPATDWGLVQKAMRNAAWRRPHVDQGRPQDPELWRLWTLCRDGRVKDVAEQLAELLQQRGTLSIKGFNYLLKGCATGAHLQLGNYVYAAMLKNGVPPDARSLGWMLRLYVRAGHVKQALPWLDAEWSKLPDLVSRETGAALSPAYFLNVLLEECITRFDWGAVGVCADHLGAHGMDSKTHLLLLQIGGLERRPESVALMWAALQEGGRPPTAAERSAYVQALARCDSIIEARQELNALGRSIQDGGRGRAMKGRAPSVLVQQRRQQEWLPSQSDGDQTGLLVTGLQEGDTGVEPDSMVKAQGESGALRRPLEEEPQEGLWWTAPPPRSTDRSTLAHMRVAYNAVIAAAARCKDVSQAEELFAEMRRADLQPDRYTYNALLRAVANAKPLEDAQRVFRSMAVGGIQPDAHTVASMVKACTQAGQYAQAAQLLADTAEADPRGPPYYAHAFNGLLEACAQQHDQALALRVFQRMRALHVPPDSCTYTALFQAFHRPPLEANPDGGAEQRQQLLMLEQDMHDSGVQHDPHTLSALVKALGPANLPLLLDRVAAAKRAAQQGTPVPLDTRVFNAVLTVCAQAAQLPAALSVFADMDSMSVRPDAATYNALLDCCATLGHGRQGLRLAARAQREGLLDAYTVNAVIKLCCFSGCYSDALPLLFDAEASGASVDCVGYNLLLSAAGRAGDLATLERVAERMRRRRIQPDGDTCLAVVEAYLQQDRADEAAEALDTLTARMFGHGGALIPTTPLPAEARPAWRSEGMEQESEALPNGQKGARGEIRGEGGLRRHQVALSARAILQAREAESQRQLHIASWRARESTLQEGLESEFVGDCVGEEDELTAAEDEVTAAVVREAMLCPSYSARNEFLARMVGVSGGGFEGPPEAWREQAALLAEVDWNSWAFRVRKEYDARRASRLKVTGVDEKQSQAADKPRDQPG